jgi:malonate decarboxylase epsilon subunit
VSTLFTFPGQGAQRAGMLHDLPRVPIVQQAIDEAGAVLHQDVMGLDGEAALQSTVATQLCLLIAGVAMARHLVARAGPPEAVAGLSIGAYPAAVIASVLSYADALKVVDRRARLMAAACPAGFGMTAVLGLDPRALLPLIAQVHTPDLPVYLANINAPTQLVIAGAAAAMEHVAALARAHGARGTKAIAIGVPSHCELLAGAARELAPMLQAVPIAAPRLRYYSASLARELREPLAIAHDLAHNMAVPVRWHETSLLAHERGTRLIVELPPGSVLTKLSAVALPDAVAVAAAETRVDSIAELMAREARRPD